MAAVNLKLQISVVNQNGISEVGHLPPTVGHLKYQRMQMPVNGFLYFDVYVN